MQFFSGLFSGKFCINYLVGVTTLDLKFSMHETELSSFWPLEVKLLGASGQNKKATLGK